MTERVLCFGPEDSLTGILTEPPADLLIPSAPAVLWLNAGLLHHVGPFGWYVELARRLAARGLRSFRFDLSGVGDSPPRNDGRDNLVRGVADVDAAMEVLHQECGVGEFLLVGLCSGAVLAHHIAGRDPRIRGAALIDGIGYRTRGYHLRYYGKRFFNPTVWANRAKRLIARRRHEAVPQETKTLLRQYFYPFPPQEQARELLTTAIGRGASMFFLYTGGVERYFNHPRQFREMFGSLGSNSDRVELHFDPVADHLYANCNARHLMFRKLEAWADRFR